MIKNHGHLEIKLFRFNHSVDYLPYYKTYTIQYTQNESVYDILNKINKLEQFSYNKKEHCNVNINNYFVSAEVLITDIVAYLGSELTINPISLYRATNDLIINTADYEEKLELFDKYLTNEQIKEFSNKYILEYYASHTLLINKDYIGDHSLLIADEIISNNPEYSKEILQILTNKDTGILYHTSLEDRLFQNRYNVELVYKKLLSIIPEYKNLDTNDEKKSTINTDIEISQYFKGFNIALYNQQGCSFSKIICKSRATYIQLNSRQYDLAFHSLLVNNKFLLQIAGEILLEAKDKNADFLIVKDEKDLSIFDGMQKKIAAIVNREINLPVLTQLEFEMLLLGEKNISKMGLNKHKIKIQFLK
ncbi:MAG: hypothetical protein CSA86_05005 [Arcobacter sp.]|nr:MAG: hypothetical protein CSA86_05005 [Arcobacter sp.]